MLDIQLNLSWDKKSGEATAYIVKAEDMASWEWVTDTSFGPFDGALDVSQWLCKALVAHGLVPAR